MPPAKCQQLTFYTWAPQTHHHPQHHHKNEPHLANQPPPPEPAPKLRRISVNLRTTGGDCRHLVYKTLSEMFGQAELQKDFSWGDSYWNDGKVRLLTLNQLSVALILKKNSAERNF